MEDEVADKLQQNTSRLVAPKSYIEEPFDGGTSEPNVSTVLMTERLAEMLGVDHPLLPIARQFESNIVQRDDVLIAMAARNGIYIPPQTYGDERGYYVLPDGQYVIREYSNRIMEVARQCQAREIPHETIRTWLRATPQEVATSAKLFGIIIPNNEIDEENEYYSDRLAFFLRITEVQENEY